MVEGPLNIDPIQTQTPVSLSLAPDGMAATNVSPDVAKARAERAVKAVPQMSMSAEQVYYEIMNGREQEVRQNASAVLDTKKQQGISSQISDAARRKGGALTPEEAAFISDRIQQNIEPTDPYAVFEEYYSKDYVKHVQDAVIASPHGFIAKFKQELPQAAAVTEEFTWQSLAKRDLVRTQLENTKDIYSKQGWLPWAGDLLLGAIPLRNQARLLGVEGTDSSFWTVELIDSALETQAVQMLQLNFPEFKNAFLKKMTDLKDDPALQLKFAESIYGKSTNDIYLGNAFDVIDKVTAGQLAGWGIKTGVKAVRGVAMIKQYNQLAKELIKASEIEDRTGMVAKEALGDTEGAAVIRTGNRLLENIRGAANPAREAAEQLPSALRVDALEITQAPGRLGREFATRLANRTNYFADAVVDMIQNLTRVQKIPEALASRIALNDIKEEVKNLYTGIRNAVMDVRDPLYNDISNTWHFDVIIGRPDATLFRTKEQASMFAKDHGLVQAVAENKQAGGGWYLRVNRPLNETSDIIRDTFLKTVDTKDPETFWSLMKAAISHVGGADESLGMQHRMNRKLATYGASLVSKLAKEEGQSIRDLAKGIIPKDDLYAKELHRLQANRLGIGERRERWNNWERVVKHARDMEDKATGLPGYFAKSPGELDTIYMDVVGRMPDALETRAYFAYKRIVEMDRMLRNVALYGKKSRQGVEQIEVHALDATGQKYVSGYFEGAVRKEFPGGDNSVLVMGDRVGDERILDLGTLANQVVLKDAKKAVAEGRKMVIEITDVAAKPMKDFGQHLRLGRPRYIIVDNDRLATKALSWDQVPRRGGGHFEYDYDYYIKQARVSTERIGARVKHWYDGDTTVMPIDLRTKGVNFVKHLEEVRTLIKNQEFDAARVYSDANLHVDFDEIHSWFKWTKDGDKKVPPRLSLKEPLRLVPRGKTIADIDNTMKLRLEADGATFKDGTKGGSMSREMQLEFTQERDAHDIWTVADKGTHNNPLYAFEPAKLVDPLPSLHRAVAKMGKSLFMDDYKTFAVERWIADAAQHLKVQGDVMGSVRSMPYYYFHQPEFLSSTPLATKLRLMNEHKKIDQLLGQTSDTQKFMHQASQYLIDGAYKTFGPGKAVAVAEWLLPKIEDPTDFIRGVTFHSSLGLFNLPQLMVQMNTFTNIAAFAGYQHASSGTYAAFMTQLTRLNKNPAIVKHLDDFLSTHNFMPGAKKWKPGEFTDSLAQADKTGYFNVAGEHTLRNNAASARIVSTGADQFLDAGAVFFREGERHVRYGAWHTAYREFRSENPLGRITDKDRAGILNRADELSVNMSRASNSILHTGLLSIPMQFYTYQLRVMEQFIGTRYTPMEKLRAFTTYATVYGVPSATGVFGFPFGDYMRRAALENGYEPGDNIASTAFHEGLLSIIAAMVTGKGNMKEGTFYNFPERYGIQGLETLREGLRSDNTMLKVMGGAAGSRFAEMWKALDPVWRFTMSFLDPEDKQYPIQDSDLIDGLKAGSAGASNALKMIDTVNTGNVYSKKGNLIEGGPNNPVSVPDAMFRYFSGLSSTRQSDLQILSWSSKEQKVYDAKTETEFIREMSIGIEVGDKDPDAAARHFQRARVLLAQRNYPEDKRGYIYSRAVEGKEPMVERIARAFATKNVPVGQETSRQDAYIKQLQKRKPQ